MSKKTTKRSLALSVLSLVICVAMLLGTTFAWFTDSVTSGVNRIVAGNLDVEVTHTNAFVTEPKSIEGETKMFVDKNGNEILWEPGAMSFENLTVANVGNLALKYKMNMNVIDYNAVADETGATLLEAIKVIVLTGGDIITDVTRETVAALDWSSAQTLGVFETSENTLLPKSDDPEREGISEESFQLIVYWQPTDADNRWNLNNGKHNTDGFKYGDEEALFIEFGVNLVAAQKEYESDSFDNQYDAGRLLPVLPQSIHKSFETPTITTTFNPTTGEVGITSVGGAPFGEGEESVLVKNKSTNTGMGEVKKGTVQAVVGALINKVGKDNIDTEKNQDSVIYINISTEKEPTATEAIYDISLSAEMTYTKKVEGQEPVSETVTIDNLTEEQLGGKTVVATVNLGAGLKQVKVKHHGNPMTKLASATPENPNVEGYFYDEIVGTLTILSKSFSPFEVTYVQPKTPSECKHKFEYEQFDPYCHYTTCETCIYKEREPHQFNENNVCTLCGYDAKIGVITLYGVDFESGNNIIINDNNKESSELNVQLAQYNLTWDKTVNGLKLIGDAKISQIDCKIAGGVGGCCLDLNGYVLTNNSWTGFDMHQDYSLSIIDSKPTTYHPGKIYTYSLSYGGNAFKNPIWCMDGRELSNPSHKTPTYLCDYTIKGGIITNVAADKNYSGVGDSVPGDGGAISTEGGVKIHMYGATIAGVDSDGDVAGICMNRAWKKAAELCMFDGSAIVGCSSSNTINDAGAVECRGGDVCIDGAHISYCSGYFAAGAVYIWAGSNLTMTSGTIDHCGNAAFYLNSGTTKLLGGTICNCEADSLIWNADSDLIMDGIVIENCTASRFMMILFPWDGGNPSLTIKGDTKFVNCKNTKAGGAVISDLNHPTVPGEKINIIGGDFTGASDGNPLFTSLDDNTFKVAGGKYMAARKDWVQAHLADGASISDNGDGTFNVIAE